ncbi:hypothetical protein TNCV_1377521 [Trichonephila clavipes]|nr:hypothetical protein TNCV_1377521 [Trichonephila clavipes]
MEKDQKQSLAMHGCVHIGTMRIRAEYEQLTANGANLWRPLLSSYLLTQKNRAHPKGFELAFAVWGALNSRRVASALMKLVKREERWEVPDPSGYSRSNLGWNERNHIVICLMLKATDNNRRASSPLP